MAVLTPSQVRYLCVNINIDGSIGSQRSVASVTKNGVGDYTIHFDGQMVGDEYHVSVMPYSSSSEPITVKVSSRSHSSFRFQMVGGAVTLLGFVVFNATPIDPDGGVSVLVCE